MPTPTRKGIFLVLLAMCLVVAVAVIPDIISEEMRAWCLKTFGEGYQGYLLGFFVVGSIILLFLTTDIGNWLRPGATPSKSDRFNIPPGAATRKQINLAKTAISQAEPEQALRHLSELKVPALDTEIATLSSRYAEYRRSSRQGINSRDEENRTYNRITKDILDLIKTLESELTTGTENYQTIKDYLKKRYTNRLGQKLANRQPVNLRQLVNTEVLPEGNKPAFIEYKSEEISGALLQTFRDTRGRMLLVGAPGAGKTTLMLQLVLELLDAEPDALPVLINLATWSHEYITLEAWLKKILPAETGTGDRFAAELIHQNRLILLFDGFDEIRQEDRLYCLEAINRYGEDSQRHYVISSRKQEFKEVDKAVLVGLPIEVCPLTLEQMKAELQRLWSNPEMPEWGAKLLLDAIEKDTLLQKAVQTPFYFNILQILFNGGMTLADLQLKADTLEGRQSELRERFVEYELKAHVNEKYPAEKVSHWLSFLASRMTERNMVVFELRDLQYDWWRWSKWQLSLGRLVSELVGNLGQVLGIVLFGGLVGGLAGLVCGLALGLVFGLVGGQPMITTRESINWSLSNFIKHLREVIILILVFVLVFILVFILVFGLLSGLAVGLLIGLTVGPAVVLGGILEDSTDFLQISSPYHRFTSSMKVLWFSILQHKFLCYQLRKQGLLPPDLVQFLNEMSLRHILEFDGDPHTGKGGGAWRFRHRILQNYFTAKYFADNASKGALEELVEEHMYDDTWKEIFLFAASMTPNTDALLLLMIKKNRKLLQEPTLNQLMNIATNALLPKNSKYSTAIRKSTVTVIDLAKARAYVSGLTNAHDYNYSLDHARYLALDLVFAFDFERIITQTIESDSILTKERSMGRYRDPTNTLVRLLTLVVIPETDLPFFTDEDRIRAPQFAKDLALDHNFSFAPSFAYGLNPSKSDFRALEKVASVISTFLRGNILIAQCLSSAAYLSKSTREYVLSMMLAPLTEEEKAAMGIKDEE